MKKDLIEGASSEERVEEETSLTRRDMLRGAMAVGLGMLAPAALLGSASARAEASVHATTRKLTQVSVKYQEKPHGDQKCVTCVQFRPPEACNLVEGKISPEGWCVLWAKKPK